MRLTNWVKRSKDYATCVPVRLKLDALCAVEEAAKWDRAILTPLVIELRGKGLKTVSLTNILAELPIERINPGNLSPRNRCTFARWLHINAKHRFD
jgi:hypothetical protein